MMEATRIAVVGFGLIGKRHAATIRQSPNLSLAGIDHEPSEHGQLAASELGVPVFTSLEEMFERAQIDGVVLATPTPLHIDQDG